MKKFILSKFTWCLFLVGLVCNVAWAQPQVNQYYKLQGLHDKSFVYDNADGGNSLTAIANTDNTIAEKFKIWYLEQGSTEGKYVLRNAGTGRYVKPGGSWITDTTPSEFYIVERTAATGDAPTYWNISTDANASGSTCLHCYLGTPGKNWSGDGGGSQFAFVEVAYEESGDSDIQEYIVDMTTGTFAGSGNYRSSWTYTTTSSYPAALTLSCGANNMNSHDGLIQLHSGKTSSPYNLTVPTGYTIVSYSFDYVFGNSGTGNKTLEVGGVNYPVTAEKQSLPVVEVNAETTSFALSGANEPVKLSNFVVRVKAPSASEVTEAKNNAKAEVELNANKLSDALGYYSYTVNGNKVYTVTDVNAAIDAAVTIAQVSAIVESFALNIPEVGKYYRIKGISGNYIDASSIYNNPTATSGQMSMKSESECNYLGTIFLLDEGNRLKNFATGTYVYETYKIGADKDGAESWTFAASTRTLGCLTLTSNYTGSKQLHDNSGDRADRCGSICGDRHDFTIEEVKEFSLTINAPAQVNASATWNGQTKKLPATWKILDKVAATAPALSISSYEGYTLEGIFENEVSLGTTLSISSLEADRTLTAKFSPAFFSATVGEKWINIVRKTNANHAMLLGSNAVDAKPTFNMKDYTNKGMMWCFVGTADNFKIYNNLSGATLALTPSSDNIGNGTEVKMVAAADAKSWKLVEKDGGYAITLSNNTDWSLNSYTGAAGSNVKFYGANDGGSHWTIDVIDAENLLTMGVTVDKVWGSSPRVAELTFGIDGSTAQTRVTESVAATTYYMPKGVVLSLNSMTYRGYTFNGIQGVDNLDNFTIPQGGLNLNVSYTANDERTLFYTPGANGHPYRIPAIATAPNGDIFAICDFRPCRGDIGNGDVDIVCRISSDNGVTWDDEIVLANGDGGSTNRMETGYGDPAIVVDRESNKILVMMVAGRTVCGDSRWDASKIGVKDAAAVNRAARVYGTLNETTGEWEWTQPEEVTDDIYKLFLDESNNATVTSYFIGSGKICQSRVVKKGEYYRLYCSLWTRDNGNRVIYSDDFGGSWNVLGTINDRPAPNGNEPKCEELPDGTVVLSSRVAGGRYFNLFTFADDTYTTGTWGTVANSTTVRDGSNQGTNGEIYKVKAIRKEDGQICDVMLQSVPAGPARTNVTVWYKEMDYTTAYTPATFAADWNVGKKVSDTESAYSTMHLQADGRIGFFFEEAPGGYTMVYIPYTLEDLTADKYSLYTVNSSIGQYEIGTFYASEAMQIPEGVKAYVANTRPELGNEEGATADLVLTEVEGIVPANTGVVLRAAADSYEFIPSISYGEKVSGNMFVGFEGADNKAETASAVALPEDGSVNYVLTVMEVEGEDVAGFYKKESEFKVYNNKAYLNLPAEVQANALRLRFVDADGTTSITTVTTAGTDASAVVYDLHGRRVAQPTKGLYIVNGKKVIY